MIPLPGEVRKAAFATPLRTAFNVGVFVMVPVLWLVFLGSPLRTILPVVLALMAFDYAVHSYWALQDRKRER